MRRLTALFDRVCNRIVKNWCYNSTKKTGWGLRNFIREIKQEDNSITIKMKRVHIGGIADKCFHQLNKQLFLSLNSFASHGRFWMLVGAREIDLLHTMQVKREEIDNYVGQSWQQKHQKFGATIQLNNGWGLRRLIQEIRQEDNPFTVRNASWDRRYCRQKFPSTNGLNRCSCRLTALHLMVGAGCWIR